MRRYMSFGGIGLLILLASAAAAAPVAPAPVAAAPEAGHGAKKPDAALVKAAREAFAGEWAHFDLHGLKPADDGAGLSGYWEGAEANGRRCEASFAVRRKGAETTTFSAPETCLKPLAPEFAKVSAEAGALAKKCQALDDAACGDLMFRGAVMGELPHLDFRGTRMLSRAACDKGSARGCAAYALVLVQAKHFGAEKAPDKAQNETAYAAAERSCTLGEPLGCVLQATMLGQKAAGTPYDPKKAGALLAKHCAAGVQPACQTREQLGL